MRREDLRPTPPAPLIVLSEPEFAAAVLQALRDFTNPTALAGNPLRRSRLLAGAPDSSPPDQGLRALIEATARSLAATPRGERLYRAVHRTYLAPAPTQERAAEVLGLPFSTYRYHLTRGVEAITATLWRRELYASD